MILRGELFMGKEEFVNPAAAVVKEGHLKMDLVIYQRVRGQERRDS